MPALRSVLPAAVERLSRRAKRLILLALDAAAAPVALAAAAWATEGILPGPALTGLAGLAGGAWSAAMGLPRVRLNACAGRGQVRIAAAALWTALLVAGMAAAAGQPLPADAALLFGLILFLAMSGGRAALRQVLLGILRLGQTRAAVLIYGAGRTGAQLATALDADARIRAVAFVDDDPALHGLTVAGLRVHAADRIAALAASLRVTRVLLAMPTAAPAALARIGRHLQDLGLTVVQVPSFAQLAGTAPSAPVPGPTPVARFAGRGRVEEDRPGGAAAYAGRVVLVTGAGGSVGSELCRQVLAMRPARLILFDLCEFALYAIDHELRQAGTGIDIVPVLGSVADGRLLRAMLTEHRVAVVLHAAAYKHVPLVEANPLAGLSNNVLGTRCLAEAAVACGVRRFVLVSSDKAVRPSNVMGATKRAAELVVQDLACRWPGTAFAVVRFGNVLGSSGSVIPLFRAQIARGGPVTLTDALATRYFMTIAEAARLVLMAGSLSDAVPGPPAADVYVLDMGRPVRIRDLAVQMIAAAGCTVRDAAHPDGDIEIVVTGLRPGEKLHEELLIGDSLLPTPHPRILRAAEPAASALQVAALLREVRAAVDAGDAAAARAVIFDHVEGARTVPAAVAAE